MKNTTNTPTNTNTLNTNKKSLLFIGQEVLVHQPEVWLVYGNNNKPIFGVTEHWIKTIITTVNRNPDDWFVRVAMGAQLSPDWYQDEFSIEEIEISGGEVRLRTIMD